jgi:hypothetical protein
LIKAVDKKSGNNVLPPVGSWVIYE